jgi:hypothetical protein
MRLNYVINSTFFYLFDLIKANQINHAKNLKEKQDLKNALMITQDTAVIQILLDLFLLIKKVFTTSD